MKFSVIPVLIGILVSVSTIAEAQFRKGIDEPVSVYQRKNRHGTFFYSAGFGISSYFGDLKDDRKQLWAKPSTQLGLQYRVNDRLHFRTEISWYRISGADSLNDPNTGIYDRNLSFRADNFELNLVGLLHLFNKYSIAKPPVNPYLIAGVGLTTNTPKANYNGEWHKLRPLKTEGTSYSAVMPVFPVGAGIAVHLNTNWDISLELGYRFTFTDYLDDVSTTYRGVENFEDPLARALSDRRPEMGLNPLPNGNRRGNSTDFDGYLITGIKVVYTPTRIPEEVLRIQK
ncbi:DUF6089 family protein [Cesiribacter sp. SM1]|uniref:outer membrane beta-barrel protein n=1 Tax=Cesiribacter sp. SM1 TaxID=2861196 RepID=UPI001CD6549E|nr:DUF6089 family protein [Cesiribacter sp. SM1]